MSQIKSFEFFIPYSILINMLFGIFKVRQHSLERTAVQLGVEPLVVKQHFSIQVREPLGADQVEWQLTKLETIQ